MIRLRIFEVAWLEYGVVSTVEILELGHPWFDGGNWLKLLALSTQPFLAI